VNSGKDRRETGGFIGAESVLKHLRSGPPRRRVGLIVEGAPARRRSIIHVASQLLTILAEGARILAPDSNEELGLSTHSGNISLTSSPHRCCYVWYPLSYTGQEYCYGLYQLWLAQEGNGSRSRSSQTAPQGFDCTFAFCKAELLEGMTYLSHRIALSRCIFIGFANPRCRILVMPSC
jgi:hypothetical protein